MTVFSPEELAQIVDYHPDTGRFFWKPRHAGMYKDWQGLTAERRAQNFNAERAGTEAFLATSLGYRIAAISCFGRSWNGGAHRVAFAIHNGFWPTMQIDHINRIRHDNRAENLRDVDAKTNSANRPAHVPRTNRSRMKKRGATNRVAVHMTGDERARIDAAALALGLQASSYLRWLAMREAKE